MKVIVVGSSHASRIVSRGPPAPPMMGGVTVDIEHIRVRGGLGGAERADVSDILDEIMRRRLLPGPAERQPHPDIVVVSLGGNALTTRAAPQRVVVDAPTLTAAVAENLRWLIMHLGHYGAPRAIVVLISAIPRAQLSDEDLSAFRRLVDAQRDVAREFSSRCVLLDVERLL